jgi:hypothetical protein
MESQMACPPRTSGKALAAFGLALLSFGLGIAVGVPALLLVALSVPLCLLARRDVRRSDGPLMGRGWARAALVVNGVSLLTVLALLPAIARVREAANKMAVH